MLKILAEAPLAKEIIENNISQLKASLQNYGLEIDKLDVFVADDSEQHDEGRKSHAFMKMQGEYEEENEDDALMTEGTEETAWQSDDATGLNCVNFFA